MRVYIGPYRNQLSTVSMDKRWYQWRYPDKDWYDIFDEGYDRWDRAYNQFSGIIQCILNKTINKFITERTIKVRIDKYDTWNMDDTLAHIILPMLKQLKDTKHGSPNVDVEDVPEHLRKPAPPLEENDPDELVHERWEYVLNEMIWAFEQLLDPNAEDQFHTGEHDHIWTKKENGNSELSLGPKDTHVFDIEGYKLFSARIDNGFRMFGKYYRGLWD